MARRYGRPTKVPSIPDPRTSKAEDQLRAIKEILEVREGQRGDKLDRVVTFRDLLDAGAVTPGQVGDVLGGPPPIPLIPGDMDPATPPTPTNLSAVGALMSITLTWDFAPGYSRLAYFEIWRSETDALGDAVVIAQTQAPIYSDVVGPEQTYYYWVRAVSDAGQSPFNAVAGTRGDTPFFLQPEDTEVNGEEVLAGVYLSSAWIMNGVITNAKIGDLAVDDAKIANLSVSKLLAGSLAVGQYIQSSNYASGDTGFHINANGNAEFNSVTVRGTVYSTAGQIGGNQIDSTGIQSSNYNSGTAGWRINSSGSVEFNNGTFRGALSAATGTFSGDVVGGQFMTGGFTGYAWPPPGQGGSYIGPNGLLLGNPADGGYFEVQANGNVLAPSFSIINGDASFYGDVTARTFSTIGGRFTADSTGAVVADQVDIRRRVVLEAGALDPTETVSGWYTAADPEGAPVSVQYTAGALFTVDIQQIVETNIYDANTLNTSANQPYYVAAYFTGGALRNWSGAGGSTFQLTLTGHPTVYRVYSNVGNTGDDFRVVIHFRAVVRIISGSFNFFRLPTATWVLYKL